MRRVTTARLQPGTILARSIYNSRGDCLVAAGVTVTPGLKASLLRRGFPSVLIADSLTDDIVLHEVISDRVRGVAIARLSVTFETLSRAAKDFRGASPQAVVEGVNSRKFTRSLARKRSLFQDISNTVESIVSEVLAVENMSGLIDLQSYDDYTFGHSIDMAAASVMIGRLLHLDQRSLHQLAMGSLLHDVGKVFLDEAVVNKNGPLSVEEMDRVRKHPEWGYELMKREDWGDVLTRHVVYQHHERQDGSGYPRGLTGANQIDRTLKEEMDRDRILLLAEIASVADVYDALSSDRPYRAALPHDRVIEMVRSYAGAHLNRQVVHCFLNMLPVYPSGLEVRVVGGEFDGWSAIVVSTPEDAPGRPVIRVFADPAGRETDPFDIALVKERRIDIVVPDDRYPPGAPHGSFEEC